ncbi:MAG: histidine phosphatase family protein, partial [Alphaproteobacteria bacterium HGW-Alphaproteobacteria-8]
TWALARAAIPGAPEAQTTPRLYHAAPATMLAEVRGAPAAAQVIALIGHQPGIGAFARKLADGATPASCARAFTRFPTGAIAVLDFDIDAWSQADWGGARFHAFAAPKELG